jgi:hypothetical protein
MTGDLKNFYLETPMDDEYEYTRIPISVIPESIMIEYKLAPLVHNGHVYVGIRKGMYGLPQAGKIANKNRLTAFLAPNGYAPAPITPGLWKHNASDLMFTLVAVDDFGVKFTKAEDAEQLMTTLKKLYTASEDLTGTKYCGLTLDWNYYTNRTVHISIPGYIERALQRFQHPTPTRPQHAPHAWQKPTYGAKTRMPPTPTPRLPSSQLTPRASKKFQAPPLLSYARAVDSKPTMEALTQLLNSALHTPTPWYASSRAKWLSTSQATPRT